MGRLRYGCRCGEGDGPPKHMASLIRVVSASAADRPTYSDLTRRRHVHSGRARGAPCNCMLKSMHRRAPGSSTTHTHTHIRSASPVALQLHVDLCRSQTIHGDAIARLGEMAPTGLYSAQKWDPATIRGRTLDYCWNDLLWPCNTQLGNVSLYLRFVTITT